MNNSLQVKVVLPSGSAAAARRRHRAKQYRGYIGREKSGLLRVSAYTLPGCASRAVPGRGPAGLGPGKPKRLLLSESDVLLDSADPDTASSMRAIMEWR